MEVERIDRADEREISVADQFHERESGPQMLAGDADDQAEIGADDLILHVGDSPADGFQLVQIAGAGVLRLDLSPGGDEFVFVKIELQEQRPLPSRSKERRAIKALQIRGQIARHAGFFAFDLARQFLLSHDLVDHGRGVFLVIEGIIDESRLSARELGQTLFHDGAADGGLGAAEALGEAGDGAAVAIGAEDFIAVVLGQFRRRGRENRRLRRG